MTNPVLDPAELRRETLDLEDRLALLREAGAFRVRQRRSFRRDGGRSAGGPGGDGGPGRDYQAEVAEQIYEARLAALREDLPESARRLSRAAAVLEEAVQGQGPFWRAVRVSQRHILLYHVVALVLILNVATGWGWFGAIAREIWGIPIEAFGFGAMGGILRGLYWLQRQVNRGIYRAQFDLAHLAAPWVSGLFGAFAFLLLKAGLVTLGGGEAPGADSVATYALVFFAGYSWEWIVQRVDDLGRGRDPAEDRPAGTGQPATPDTASNGATTPGALAGDPAPGNDPATGATAATTALPAPATPAGAAAGDGDGAGPARRSPGDVAASSPSRTSSRTHTAPAGSPGGAAPWGLLLAAVLLGAAVWRRGG